MTDSLVADRYRMVRRIGVGGMGHVWLARDEVLRRNVAVKEVYLPDGLSGEEVDELRLRTLREARAAARLTHPSVIRIYDVLQARDRPWIVMEYVPSRSLAQVILEDGPMPPQRVANIGLALLAALTAAHEAGVLHRDVKPGNVLLADDGRIVLTDFGLAIFDDLGMQVTRAGVVHGSPQFIAPERAQDGTSTAASDFWSLGATLYAAVEGRSPYARPSSYATLAALATEPPDTPQRAGDLKPVLAGLLRRNPRNRISPADAERLLQQVASNGRDDLIPRQLIHDSSDDVSIAAAVGGPPAGTAVIPHGLPIRNRRKYADEQRTRVPEPEPSAQASRSEFDTDQRMAQAWALATPGPIPTIKPDTKPDVASRPRSNGRRGVMTAAAMVVLLGVAAGAGTYALTSHGFSKNGATPAATHTVGALPPPMAVTWPCPPPVEGSTAPIFGSTPIHQKNSGLNPGFIWFTDSLGFQITAPARMQLAHGADVACMYDPDVTRIIAVKRTETDERDATRLLSDQLEALKNRGGMRNFAMTVPAASVPYLNGQADAQFTYEGPRGKMHAEARDYVDQSGIAYTLLWETTDFDWQTNVTYYGLIVTSFQRVP